MAIFTAMAFAVLGCKSGRPAPSPAKPAASAPQYPAWPAVAAPPFKVFHQTADTFTLVTKDRATDNEVESLIWELRNAAHTHTFDKLKIDQKVIDARKPIIWFHVYRGAKCASEKYTAGKLPCDASYHAAGDYTFGDYTNHNWDQGTLRHGDSETPLWNPDDPYALSSKP